MHEPISIYNMISSMSVEEGKKAPDFTLPDQEGNPVSLSGLRGKPVVLYFYPKDNTPGCTKQACGIRDSWNEFEKAGAVVLGVSTDGQKSHSKFQEKHSLPFTLLSDSDHEVAQTYGVWKPLRILGKEFLGTERSTFVIGADGNVLKVMRKVKASEHAEDVLRVFGS